MKNVSLFIVLLIISRFSIKVKAQTTEIDSLKKIVLQHSTKDTIRVNILNEIANAFQNINPQRTLKYATEAGKLSDSLNYRKGKAETYDQIASYYKIVSDLNKELVFANKSLEINKEIGSKKGMAKNLMDIGKIYYFQGDVKKAMDYLKDALEINIAINDSLAICYNYASLGTNYDDAGEYELALHYGKEALRIANKINDEKAISYALNNLAVIYETQGNYPIALRYYQKSFLIDERLKDYKGAAVVASNIALILKLQGNYTHALEFCEKGLYYSELIGFKTGLSYNYEYMGLIYKAQGNYEKAWESFQKTLTLQQEIGNKRGIAIGYRDLANLYILQGKLDKAKDYYERSLKISKTIEYKPTEISSYVGLSKVYYRQKNYKRAHKFSRMAYTMAKDIGSIVFIKQSTEVLAKSNEALGLYKEAYKIHVEFKSMSDSLHNEENTKKIANLENEFKYEKEKEVLKLEQQKKDKLQAAKLKKQKVMRNTLLGGFVLMILLAIFIYYSFVKKRKANKLLQIKNNEIENQAEELISTNESLVKLSQFKQDMTNLVVHDLKNPLSTIVNIDMFNDDSNQIKIVKQAGFKMLNLVQNILDVYKYESTEIELSKENIDLLEILNNAKEEVEFSAKLREIDIRIEIDNRIVLNADAEILRRVFVNILSNAVRYSIRDSIINIYCCIYEENNLKVSIHNFGSYIPIEMREHIFEKYGQVEEKSQGKMNSTGLGLAFCKLAVEAHNGIIGVNSDEVEGTTFWFTLPEAKVYEMQNELLESKRQRQGFRT